MKKKKKKKNIRLIAGLGLLQLESKDNLLVWNCTRLKTLLISKTTSRVSNNFKSVLDVP
ncbi:hypothetical protein WN943_001219 [Citrus x changshan-huyou]